MQASQSKSEIHSHSIASGSFDELLQNDPSDAAEGYPIQPTSGRRSSFLRRPSANRRDHFRRLVSRRRARDSVVQGSMKWDGADPSVLDQEDVDDDAGYNIPPSPDASIWKEIKAEKKAEFLSARVKEINELTRPLMEAVGEDHLHNPIDIRVDKLTYSVPLDPDASKIHTVYNSSFLYPTVKLFKQLVGCKKREVRAEVTMKNILEDIDLVLRPGKAYLVLGPPGSGKSTLLRAMAGILRPEEGSLLSGKVVYNGVTLKESEEFYICNAFAYVDQLDKHAPRLTVEETFEFAFQCKSGGKTIRDTDALKTEEDRQMAAKADREGLRNKLTLLTLGLTEVKDTFVGDDDVRGVSGGQRRRVTLGEMMMTRVPVLFGDEISTGLDAASTYDIVEILSHFAKISSSTRVISLFQPSPETVSLFDEVILLSEGHVIYAGPIEQVEDYFAEIGYRAPEFVDVADFLQMVSTEDGADLYEPTEEVKALRPDPPNPADLAQIFRESKFGKRLKEAIRTPSGYAWKDASGGGSSSNTLVSEAFSNSVMMKKKYANSFPRSLALLFNRFILLWTRDRRVIIAGIAKNVIMGVSVGGVFFDTTDIWSILGVLFQAGLFIMLGAMQNASGLVSDRVIYNKHTDANFYSAWPFMFARTFSQLPQTVIDTIMFATYLYFMVGLGDRKPGNFFIFLSILFVFSITINLQLALFASFASQSSLQTYSSCILLLYILFGGFIVAPSAIPNYFIWLYWWNPFAWAYRALVVLEFRSARWGDDSDQILLNIGFTLSNGEPFGREWVGYSFAYMISYFLLCCVGAALGLTHLRHEVSSPQPSQSKDSSSVGEGSKSEKVELPFKHVTLTFEDISYEVHASTGKETLQLLTNVNGVFQSGRMCALMGSSGAGKTTLMDVVALRKRSGTVTGEVRLNGHLQEPISFRRCSGYVEQFDVQTPQLTVRETVMFSAKMRLEPGSLRNETERSRFVDQVLSDVELSSLANSLVGTDEEGGLSFEQKKRLSIAVELAASPSVIFLDEPTSGLDARSALIVVKALRRISDKGRTICATIHQPSSAVFDMFDDLLLLRKGGQVVFQGELGDGSNKLISYFESRGATKINLGENPANWMLRVITSESMGDLAATYIESDKYTNLKEELGERKNSPDPKAKVEYESQFAVSWIQRQRFVNQRSHLIYWRSPTYNVSWIMVSIVIALVLGSVFITRRSPDELNEVDVNARLAVIFLSFIIVGIMAMLSVLPVMTLMRDMLYRHQDAGMYAGYNLGIALGVAEQMFIVASSTLFCFFFLVVSDFGVKRAGRYIGFWGFFTFSFSIYVYFGQCFVALVKPMATAYILCSVFMGMQNFFSGLVVRPELLLGNFFSIPYYITPGHYVYEGLVVVLYAADNETKVLANEGSSFQQFLIDDGTCTVEQQTACTGKMEDYIHWFFGGDFVASHIWRNIVILGGFLVFSRIATILALKYIRFD